MRRLAFTLVIFLITSSALALPAPKDFQDVEKFENKVQADLKNSREPVERLDPRDSVPEDREREEFEERVFNMNWDEESQFQWSR